MTDQVISPLRRHMIEDLAIRKFARKSQHYSCNGSRISRRSSAVLRICSSGRRARIPAASGIGRRRRPRRRAEDQRHRLGAALPVDPM
jgi:hypothetical protein